MAKHRAALLALVLLVASAVFATLIIFGSVLFPWLSSGGSGFLGLLCLLGLALLAVLIIVVRRFRPK